MVVEISSIFQLFDLVFAGVLKFSAKGAAAAESLCYFVAFFLILLYNRVIIFSGKGLWTDGRSDISEWDDTGRNG